MKLSEKHKKNPLNILIVEDSKFDAELIVMKLKQENLLFTWQCVETEPDYLEALKSNPDIILSDWSLPQFSGMRALKIMQDQGLNIPFIIISGSIGDEAAVDALHKGVYDYILKDRPERIGQAVLNAIEQKRILIENQIAVHALEESEAELRALFASMQDVVIVLDSEGVYQKIAPTNPGLLVKPANELLGKSLTDIFPADQAQFFKQEIQYVLQSNVIRHIEYLLNINDRDFWFDTTINRMSKDRVVWVARDITERKLSEATLLLQSKALDSAANAIVITDRDGVINWINPAYTQLTGYTAAEVIGKNPNILNSGVQPKSFYKKLWNTILDGQVWHSELVNKRKDGSLYTEEQTITPLIDQKGKISHFIAIKQDVSERKKSEFTLQQYAQRQEKIAALGRSLAATLELDEIYQITEDFLKEMIDFSNFGFTLFDAKKDILTATYFTSNGVPIDLSLLPPLKYNPDFLSSGRFRAIFSKAPVIINDLATQRITNDGIQGREERNLQSAIYIPLVSEEQVVGLLDLKSYRKDAYNEKDGEWLSVVANQIAMTIQNARLFKRVQTRMEELTALSAIDSAVTSHLGKQEIFNILLEQVINRLEVDAANILMYDPESTDLVYGSSIGYKNPLKKDFRIKKGKSLSGKVAYDKSMLHIRQLSGKNAHLLLDISRNEGFEDYIGVPLLLETKLIGVLGLFHRSPLNPDEDWMRFLEILAGQAAIVIEHNQLFDDLQIANEELLKAYDATIEGWSQAMDLRDEETEGHTQRVTELTLHLAKTIGLEDEELVHIRRGSLLHDIGKLGVPDAILLKPGILTDEEWEVMKIHPKLARQMLEKVEYLKPAMDIPYCHHERWDGSGYPRGLKGEEIPLAGRIFAIVDVWDALTSDRPYRAAWSKEKTLQHIMEQKGKHFDPQIVDIFVEYIKPKYIDK